MRINFKILVSLIAAFLCLNINFLSANNNTNSPYTRFGYGEIQDQTFARSKGMGGLSYGLRSRKGINPANPASYSSIDSTSFIFEFGASGILSTFNTQDAQKTTFNGNLEYIAMQMPISRWMGLSLGMLPFSFIGYDYEFGDSLLLPSNMEQDTVYNKYTQSFKGSGGISQVYLGLSFDLWNHLALGVNGYYMFGSIDHYRSLIYEESSISSKSISKHSELYVNNFNLRFGLQYHESIGQKHDFTIGAVYEFQTPLKGDLTETTVGTDTVEVISTKAFDMPNIYGLGFSYTYDKRLMLGIDATYTEYSKAKYYGVPDTLSNTLKLAIGAEYMHNPKGKRYADRMMWRFGVNYNNSYIKLDDNTAHNFVVTCGVGFPVRRSKSLVNLSLEYGNVGIRPNSMLKEQYIRLGVNVTLNETWFLRSKIR